MKNIFITQGIYKDVRNNFFSKIYLEWFKYAKKLKFNLHTIPINSDLSFLKKFKADGVIFSGGNDIYKISKKRENYLRDEFEKKLIKYIILNNIPSLFVCRGMQLLCSINKIKLKKTNKHVTKNQKIILNNNKSLIVNSYHNYIVKKKPKNFIITAKHLPDNSIEILSSKKYKILCFMFHPERKSKSQKAIDKMFKTFFKL